MSEIIDVPVGFEDSWSSGGGSAGGGGSTPPPQDLTPYDEIKSLNLGVAGKANEIYFDNAHTPFIWDGVQYVKMFQPTATERTFYRDNLDENIAPTAIEVQSPISGDTATVYLKNSMLELWRFTSGAWVLVQTLKENLERVISVNQNYAIDIKDDVIVVDSSTSPITISLPLVAEANGKSYTIKAGNYINDVSAGVPVVYCFFCIIYWWNM